MSKGDHSFKKRAKGATGGGYARARTQVGFDAQIRKLINLRAKANGRSFAAEVRALVAFALDELELPR